MSERTISLRGIVIALLKGGAAAITANPVAKGFAEFTTEILSQAKARPAKEQATLSEATDQELVEAISPAELAAINSAYADVGIEEVLRTLNTVAKQLRKDSVAQLVASMSGDLKALIDRLESLAAGGHNVEDLLRTVVLQIDTALRYTEDYVDSLQQGERYDRIAERTIGGLWADAHEALCALPPTKFTADLGVILRLKHEYWLNHEWRNESKFLESESSLDSVRRQLDGLRRILTEKA